MLYVCSCVVRELLCYVVCDVRCVARGLFDVFVCSLCGFVCSVVWLVCLLVCVVVFVFCLGVCVRCF